MALTESQIKTFVDGFKYDTSIDGDVRRKYLAHYVNVGTTEAPSWEILGYKVEDASVEFNWEEETVTDITGTTYKSITKSEPTLTLDGYIMNTNSEFLDKLAKTAIRDAYNEFSSYEILTVYYWLTKAGTGETSTQYLAKIEKDCNITPSSIGGQGYVRISPTITLSNKATWGTVSQAIGASDTEFVEATTV